MVRAIITWSLHNRLVVLLGTVLLISVGLYSATHLNVEAYPDPTPPLVEVITQNPGASPEEMERRSPVSLISSVCSRTAPIIGGRARRSSIGSR
jgi:Cu/Ag efflux pump CusA